MLTLALILLTQTPAEVDARNAAQLAQTRAEIAAEQAAEDKRRERCGKDYGRVRVGMRWSRVQECAGPFVLTAEDEHAAYYEAEGGAVRVERGRVVRWIAKP